MAQSKNRIRLNEDLRREIISIVNTMKDPRIKQGLVTITRVEAAKNLTTAKIYVSVLDSGKPEIAKLVVKALESAKGHIRSEVASRMHIRRSPELFFVEDDNAAYADNINKLLRELENKI